MDKKVLILCTGNSCRSIIAEALINAKLDGISSDSSGVKASGRVNPNAKKLLEEKNIWKDEYHSKTIDTVINNQYDLVITVCDNANETCPVFQDRNAKKIHRNFNDPSKINNGLYNENFDLVRDEIKNFIIEFIKSELT